MTKKYDIFISHSKEDNKLAVALCHFLEQNQFRCWMAPRDVQAGKDYAACIIEAIQASRIMVVILSEYSNKSHHVRNEVERAFNHQVAILPFRIRDVIPEQSLEYFLSSYHWLDAIDGQAENYFETLYRHCSALLSSDQSFDPPKPPDEDKKPPYQPFFKKSDEKRQSSAKPADNKAIYIAGIVILLIVVFFLLIKPFFKKHAIQFVNNAPSSVYLNVDGKIDTIKPMATFNYEARRNSRLKTDAYAYWTNLNGAMLGVKIKWNIDTLVHAEDDFSYPLNVNSDYFFLKVINNSGAYINYITVNGNDPSDKYTLSLKIPNDGTIYYIGYFKILPDTKIEIWNNSNYYVEWTNYSNLHFSNVYNQIMTLNYK